LPAIRALFWDVGGVLLTNAWDRTERAKALEHFHLDEEEFHDRHEMVVSSFERGKITLDEYLDRTVFYRPRPFDREAFRDYMFSLSQPFPDVLAFAQTLTDSNKYFMGTINNESRELNNQRIESLDCGRSFVFSSVPAMWDFGSRNATFIALRWKRRRFLQKNAASSTIVLSTWSAQRSWACILLR
jgi:FMN phosphatase YigB (HAD superfamily)